MSGGTHPSPGCCEQVRGQHRVVSPGVPCKHQAPLPRLPFLQLWSGCCWILALQQVEWDLMRAKELLCPTRVQGPQGGSVLKNPPANAGDTGEVGSIPGLGRCPGEGSGNPFQYSYLEKPWTEEPSRLWSMGVKRRQTRLKRLSMHAPIPSMKSTLLRKARVISCFC